ncbi:tRNA 2-selenouridine(34) synthase MnmH [Leptolyngbya sp. FACHB-541]|uniref:tRNA 2-selenouridine(34) synthase MnmH n=1 Tax=Leptolyngbya sp. FACHB-541 TaxID=2692810 RepID=UPI0016871B39|nr:tRNA 2-selenouridine(34) synthase MnmH [Leptolyngbya sp. FACHB-541]MBD1999816.1 tRNA 2-selenouridine(34) synthase MnmH [Leptolyngbya sp. FACHB-541]
MPHSFPISDFLNTPGIILDVRSPNEYAQGHIPNAKSFPLFTDEERAQVGTCYKQQGREQAVELGFAIAGPKFVNFITQAKALAPDKQVRIHCWRGGMRSGAVAWVLEMAGFQVSTLKGGYKTFRNWALNACQTPKPIITLGGMTGTGKTNILTALAAQGAQTLDLEQLASHRGSSFGSLGLPPQPSNEHFENRVAIAWSNFDPAQPVWIEAESCRIGICRVPDPLFQQMIQAPIIQVVRPRAERLALLVEVYGSANIEELIGATERIRKRLGGLRTQQAIALLQQRQLTEAFDLILEYYDKTYQYDLEKRKVPIYSVDVTGLSDAESAALLLEKAKFYCQELC